MGLVFTYFLFTTQTCLGTVKSDDFVERLDLDFNWILVRFYMKCFIITFLLSLTKEKVQLA